MSINARQDLCLNQARPTQYPAPPNVFFCAAATADPKFCDLRQEVRNA